MTTLRNDLGPNIRGQVKGVSSGQNAIVSTPEYQHWEGEPAQLLAQKGCLPPPRTELIGNGAKSELHAVQALVLEGFFNELASSGSRVDKQFFQKRLEIVAPFGSDEPLDKLAIDFWPQ